VGLTISDYNKLSNRYKKSTYHDNNLNRKFPCVLVTLLIHESKPIGVLYIESDEIFRENDIKDLQIYANQATNILESSNFIKVNYDIKNAHNVDYRYADLKMVNFQNFNLNQANFSHAILTQSNFRNADLTGSQCVKSNFTNSELQNVKFVNANLYKAIFIDSNLQGASLSYADLKETNFENADILGSTIEYANFENANLSNLKFFYISVKKANFKNAKFVNSNLQLVRNVEEANWEDADITGSIIDSQTLEKLPKSLIDKYKGKFQIINIESHPNITRTIEFQNIHYLNVGKPILDFFSQVIISKYSDESNKFKLIQDDLSVTIVIKTTEKNRDEIEKHLMDYGYLINGDKEAINVLKDELIIKNYNAQIIFAQDLLERYNSAHQLNTSFSLINKILYNGICQDSKKYMDQENQKFRALEKKIGELVMQRNEEVNISVDSISNIITKLIIGLFYVMLLVFTILTFASSNFILATITVIFTIITFVTIPFSKVRNWLNENIKSKLTNTKSKP